MGVAIGIAVVLVISLALGYWMSNVINPKLGLKPPREMSWSKRWRLWTLIGVTMVISGFAAWALTSGHAAVGIAVLIAVFVLPEFVLVPLRIRRSRRAADAARARRTGRGSGGAGGEAHSS